jgi:integrase
VRARNRDGSVVLDKRIKTWNFFCRGLTIKSGACTKRQARKAGIGGLGTHSLRHTYRSWLDAVGTPIAVQQKLMRHADIRTTMNIYGDVVTDEMAVASGKVTRLALNGRWKRQVSSATG